MGKSWQRCGAPDATCIQELRIFGLQICRLAEAEHKMLMSETEPAALIAARENGARHRKQSR